MSTNKKFFAALILFLTSSSILSCGGGGGGEGGSGRSGGSASADFGCDGSCANQSLSTADVRQIISNAIKGANIVGVKGTFAVLDRVGNVLAVYQMPGAPGTTRIDGQIGASGGLEGASVPSTIAAISKAGTGAYLSSQGNAFSTRTASQIVQENFNPNERRQPGGPLFGVQFSQLICSDVTVLNPEVGASAGGRFNFGGGIGPRPLPLGLAGDPGGLPLYKSGDVVGGIGVEFDRVYRVDTEIRDTDDDPEERVALFATLGFEAPSQRVAPNVNIGKSLRYTDLGYEDLGVYDASVPTPDESAFVSVAGYTNGSVKAGVTFGSVASGIAKTVRAGTPAANLVTPSGAARYPTIAGSSLGGSELSAREVNAILDSALVTSFRARAAIRRPLDTGARVSIWVVDHLGNPLGFTRGEDAPVFGIDVALQKARTAAFFSSRDAGAQLSRVGSYNAAANAFASRPAFDGTFAYSARSIGNLARPFFPDGINGNINGPLSLPFPGVAPGKSWSPFNDGLQLDLVAGRVLAGLSGSFSNGCTDFGQRLGNGIQIFPGGVPLYRNGTLVGGIGVSGDGIDQDDMTAFYGSARTGLDFIGRTDVGDAELGFNAPLAIRADNLDTFPVQNVRLRYVNCPEGPFAGSNEQNVCEN